MNTIALIVLFFGVVAAKHELYYDLEDAIDHFEEFIIKYNKVYDDESEKAMRYEIFMDNLDEINQLNEKHEFTEFGINQFSDLRPEEFVQKHTCFSFGDFESHCQEVFFTRNETDYESTPEEFDWRSQGVVTEALQQGNCGSCWAFSVIGNVESAHAIKTGQLQMLSKQELVDCDQSSSGCVNGNINTGLGYIVEHGAMYETDYPYEGVQGSCRYDADKAAVKLSKCLTLSVTEDELAQKLYNLGPLSIGIDSTCIQRYTSGVLRDEACVGRSLNHAVLLVGYGKDSDGTPYWLIKNSWGPDWGENGHFKLKRGINCALLTNSPAMKAVV